MAAGIVEQGPPRVEVVGTEAEPAPEPQLPQNFPEVASVEALQALSAAQRAQYCKIIFTRVGASLVAAAEGLGYYPGVDAATDALRAAETAYDAGCFFETQVATFEELGPAPTDRDVTMTCRPIIRSARQELKKLTSRVIPRLEAALREPRKEVADWLRYAAEATMTALRWLAGAAAFAAVGVATMSVPVVAVPCIAVAAGCAAVTAGNVVTAAASCVAAGYHYLKKMPCETLITEVMAAIKELQKFIDVMAE